MFLLTHSFTWRFLIGSPQGLFMCSPINQNSIPKRVAERFIVKNTLTERETQDVCHPIYSIDPKKLKHKWKWHKKQKTIMYVSLFMPVNCMYVLSLFKWFHHWETFIITSQQSTKKAKTSEYTNVCLY